MNAPAFSEGGAILKEAALAGGDNGDKVMQATAAEALQSIPQKESAAKEEPVPANLLGGISEAELNTLRAAVKSEEEPQYGSSNRKMMVYAGIAVVSFHDNYRKDMEEKFTHIETYKHEELGGVSIDNIDNISFAIDVFATAPR